MLGQNLEPNSNATIKSKLHSKSLIRRRQVLAKRTSKFDNGQFSGNMKMRNFIAKTGLKIY